MREEEIKREEERLRRMEEEAERRRAEERDRRHREERERERERERRQRREQEVRHRSRSPVRQTGGRRTRGRSAERSSHHRRSSSSSRRSALDRLGPKVPVSSRLGAGKVSRKRRRPGSKERYAISPSLVSCIAGTKSKLKLLSVRRIREK